MKTARVVLGTFGVVFLVVGIYYLVSPVAGAEIVGIRLDTPMARADLRAVYGGLDFAVGLLLVRSAWLGDVLVGLRIQTYVFAGLLLGRILGQALDNPSDALVVWLLLIELAGLISAIGASRRLWAPTAQSG